MNDTRMFAETGTFGMEGQGAVPITRTLIGVQPGKIYDALSELENRFRQGTRFVDQSAHPQLSLDIELLAVTRGLLVAMNKNITELKKALKDEKGKTLQETAPENITIDGTIVREGSGS